MAIEIESKGGPGSSGSRTPRPPLPFKRLRDWLAERLSIRQRLTLWYAMLLTLLLALLSVVTFTVAQNQIQNNLNTDLRMRAAAIATALQNEEYSSQGGSNVLPTTTPAATQTPGPADAPTPTGAAGATATPLPATTPDPATNAAIQKQLTLTVPDVLGRLDIGFEVLDANGRLKYLAPTLNNRALPVNYAIVNTALRGTAGTYATRVDGALLAIYAQPIVINTRVVGRSANATATPGATSAAAHTTQVAGVVLVAKSEEDVNGALGTLLRILLIGDLVAIFCALVGGWLIAESSMRPITTITRAARAIGRDASAAGLGTRVNYRGATDEVGELVTTFNEMLSSLEQVANAQRRFVSDASHELRAPLTTIRGNLELLRQAPDLAEADRAEIIDDAYVEAERMSSLVSDLLLLARVDAASASRGARAALIDEKLSGRREFVEMDQFAMELYRSGLAQLRALHKHLNLSVTEIAPVAVNADPGQIRQLGMILLDNAIKYTPRDGHIRIAVSQIGPFAAFTVSDTGIGISEDELPHIYERFYRADVARERDEHGSGLGLAIARWIIETHHGEIKVESGPGKGTTFTVLLPAAKRIGDQTTPKVATGRRKRVRPSPISLDAIRPLARFAQSVSRPVTRPRPDPAPSMKDISRGERDDARNVTTGSATQSRSARRRTAPRKEPMR